MKRILCFISCILAICLLASCDEATSMTDDPSVQIRVPGLFDEVEESFPDLSEEDCEVILLTYTEAQELGYEGTLAEFLKLVKGADGKDGRGIQEVKISDGALTLYFTDGTYVNLGQIIGEKGEDGLTPFIGENGNWWIGDVDTGIKAQGEKGDKGDTGAQGSQGEDGLTPFIGENGNWWIGDVDTGIKAQGEKGDTGAVGVDGEDGLTPFIGENGNWWIGDVDTGIKAQGEKGDTGAVGVDGEDGLTPFIGENGNWWIGDVDTDIKAQGEKGDKGDTGAQGPQGEQGIQGEKGDTGVGIENIEFDEDGNLIVTLTDKSVKNLGKVTHDNSFAFSEVKITERKTLVITLSNGIELETAPFDVTFGGYINGVSVNTMGEMLIHTSFGSTVNYGKIDKIYVNDEGNIIILFESGKELSFGSITEGEVVSCTHSYGDAIESFAPTCSSIGYNKFICSECNYEKFEFFEALGHEFGDSFIVKEPNAYENGLMLTACKVCGIAKMQFIDGYSKGLSYERTDKDTYKVTGIGTCTDENIKVPNEHEGLPVTEIGEKAFFDCDAIVSIILPDTIEKVGDKAFSECESLATVSMSDTVEIGLDVFRGSINVEIIITHFLVYIEAKEATCTEPGNVAYYWCETCNLAYEDEEGQIRIYDYIIPSSHDFEDGVCRKCGVVQDNILIEWIDSIPHLGKFALGTLENAIGLPERIQVRTKDGITHNLAIEWNLSDYDKSTVGEYTIKGIIQSDKFHYADSLTNTVSAQVEIVDYMKGTADIVFILDISGSMGDEISNVKNNIQNFAQAIEDRGVSARWAAITYSDLTVSGLNEESTIIMNNASTWYTDAYSYKSAIGSIDLAYGGDSPETAIDGLMLALNELETRKDARTFYILLTDDTYKIANNYGITSMEEAVDVLAENKINVSTITPTDYYSSYSSLVEATGGIQSDIYGDFANDLLNNLVPIIYDDVIS